MKDTDYMSVGDFKRITNEKCKACNYTGKVEVERKLTQQISLVFSVCSLFFSLLALLLILLERLPI